MRSRYAAGAAASALSLCALLAGLNPGQAARADTVRPAQPGRTSFHYWPITITVQTVPALPGVRFAFDGRPLVTGPHGTASVTEQHNFSGHTLSLLSTRIRQADRRYTFARWTGQRDPNQAFLATVHGLPMRASYTVTASFGIWCPVTPRFTDQFGLALDPARISAVSIRSNTGQAASLSPAGTTWLPCATMGLTSNIVHRRALRYSVQAVMTGGTNIVHAGIEQIAPLTTPNPTVVGYYHSLTITAHDALFGSPTGTRALVTLPDKTVLRVPLGREHSATLRMLPQGNYRVAVEAGHAVISTQVVRLSRDQSVDVTAITLADLATLAGGVLVVLLGLPLLSGQRRRRLVTLVRRSREEAAAT